MNSRWYGGPDVQLAAVAAHAFLVIVDVALDELGDFDIVQFDFLMKGALGKTFQSLFDIREEIRE